jgi:amino acid adenylation domain-containing protein
MRGDITTGTAVDNTDDVTMSLVEVSPFESRVRRSESPTINEGSRAEYSREKLIPDLVSAQAALTPEAVAVAANGEALTYGELDRRANQLACHLQTLGVGPDVPVGLCLERSAELVVGALGIMKAGGAYVPLDPSYPADRLTFMLQDAQAPVVVTQARLAPRLQSEHCQIVATDRDAAILAQAPAEAPVSETRASHLAYVIYTSGSTGQPKGVEISHDSLLNLVFWHRHAFAVTASDRATQLAGTGFDAVVWELWPYLTAGASIHMPDESTRVAPRLLRDWLVAEHITITFLPTPLAEAVLTLDWPPETALRVLLTGADTLHRYPPASLPFALVNNYGPTENTVVATSGLVPPDSEAASLPSIGVPIDNVQIHIVDEQLREVPVGKVGELCIGGVGLARGYRSRPDLTADKFIANPFDPAPGARLYRTGDSAKFLPDGRIAFLGRIDAQLKIRGFRVEPTEVVARLSMHPAIQTCAVAAKDDTTGDKTLIAYLVPTTESRVPVSELRDFAADALPDHMVPALFVWIDSLPLTPNGKLDVAALPEPDSSNIAQDDEYVAPRTPLEERLAAILGSVLGIDRVGIFDNFFLLGGHSLLGTQVIARVSDTFGVELTLYNLFTNPTLAELSAEIEGLILSKLDSMSEDEAARLLGESDTSLHSVV